MRVIELAGLGDAIVNDSDEVTIRSAVPSDISALISLAERYCIADNAEWNHDRAHQAFEPLLQDARHGVVLVLERKDTLFGYAVLTWGWSIEAGGRESLLDEMYVDEPGHGYGSTLLEAVVETARQHGAVRVFLETESANENARTFWLHRGFELEDSVWLQRSC